MNKVFLTIMSGIILGLSVHDVYADDLIAAGNSAETIKSNKTINLIKSSDEQTYNNFANCIVSKSDGIKGKINGTCHLSYPNAEETEGMTNRSVKLDNCFIPLSIMPVYAKNKIAVNNVVSELFEGKQPTAAEAKVYQKMMLDNFNILYKYCK